MTSGATGCPTWCSWAWGSRWPTTPGCWRRYVASPGGRNGFGISARSVTVSTVGLAPAIRKLADERTRGHVGAVTARPGRRTARHPGAGQQPVEGRRGAGCRPLLRRADRSSGLGGIRVDPRRQRPTLARGPAGQAAAPRARPAGAREPDSAEPDTRAASGTPARSPRSGSSFGGSARPACRAPCATPAVARSPPRAASSPPTADRRW